MIKTTDYISQLKTTGSRTAKEAILSQVPHDHKLWKMISYAFDMDKMFYVTSNQLSGISRGVREEFVEDDFILLDLLASRTFTGHQARDKVLKALSEMVPDLQDLFLNILDKNFGCGVGEKTVNKIRPNFIKIFEVQLAEPMDARKVVMPSYVQTKLDGMRVLAFLRSGDVVFVSRNGKPVLTLEHLKPQLIEVFGTDPNLVVDGEVKKPGHFNDTTSAVKRKEANEDSAEVEFHIFDVLTLTEFEMNISQPYKERYKVLHCLDMSGTTHLKPLTHTLVETLEEAHKLFGQAIEDGHEGIIIKNPMGAYRRKRTFDWIKMKAEETVDVPIVGVKAGSGKYEGTLGAVIVDYKGAQVAVSGMTDEVRNYIWDNQEAVLGKIIEVKYHEVTPDGSLRHPRMKKFRPDKDV